MSIIKLSKQIADPRVAGRTVHKMEHISQQLCRLQSAGLLSLVTTPFNRTTTHPIVVRLHTFWLYRLIFPRPHNYKNWMSQIATSNFQTLPLSIEKAKI